MDKRKIEQQEELDAYREKVKKDREKWERRASDGKVNKKIAKAGKGKGGKGKGKGKGGKGKGGKGKGGKGTGKGKGN